MSLVLGIAKADGIYLSVDYRVTDARSRKVLDDRSIKCLSASYPPYRTGPKALMGFTGVAALRDGTPMGTWLRETMRGEIEVINASMAHLRTRLDRDVAPLRQPFLINLLVLESSGRQLFGAFTNYRPDYTVERSFTYFMQEIEKPRWFVSGSGGRHVRDDTHLHALLRSQLNVTPRTPRDHMKLLASVNRRVAARESTVSPFCQVMFISTTPPSAVESTIFTERGEYVPFSAPFLMEGLDLTDGLLPSGNQLTRRP